MATVKLPKAYSKYGAQMGRAADTAAIDAGGLVKARLFKVELDSGGYDNGGAYWGLGDPIYCAMADGLFLTVRAKSRREAAGKFADQFKSVSFKFRGL